MSRAPATEHLFKVELWDESDSRPLEVLATSSSIWIARAAFEEAVRRYPGAPVLIRQGIRVVESSRDP